MAVELYDEHEQSERVRNWMRENGVSVLMGVVLALAGIFGWRQWQDYQSTQAMLANEYYASVQREVEAGNLEAATQQFATLRETVGEHGYLALAGLLIAGEHAARGELDAAADIYAELRKSKSWDALQPLLRIRHAQVESARGQADAALVLLQGEAPSGFEGLWQELRGDALH
ncbi:MAG: tetratricopeptide repeat protein, partial [Gammaproteobacteria bacterium]|nr:tetratricopeptide repeat protein [Gammaproteobacteria bacterium]